MCTFGSSSTTTSNSSPYPSAFEEQNCDKFVFTMSDGKVLPKVVVERLLREAALRMGMDPRILAYENWCLGVIRIGLRTEMIPAIPCPFAVLIARRDERDE